MAALKVETLTQVCKVCGKEKPISEFNKSHLGLYHTCKACVRNHQVEGRLAKKLAKTRESDLKDARSMRLQEFTPRELMNELKRRGYSFQMKYTEVHVINSEDI